MIEQGVIGVCHGQRCGDYGGRALADALRQRDIEVEALDCQSLCTYAPIACHSGRMIHRATMDRLTEPLA